MKGLPRTRGASCCLSSANGNRHGRGESRVLVEENEYEAAQPQQREKSPSAERLGQTLPRCTVIKWRKTRNREQSTTDSIAIKTRHRVRRQVWILVVCKRRRSARPFPPIIAVGRCRLGSSMTDQRRYCDGVLRFCALSGLQAVRMAAIRLGLPTMFITRVRL